MKNVHLILLGQENYEQVIEVWEVWGVVLKGFVSQGDPVDPEDHRLKLCINKYCDDSPSL
jgi:hypothetical protein